MKQKLISFAALLFAGGIVHAQITPSMSIPNPIPNYDGTYSEIGQGHLFYPNDGEIRFADEEQGDAQEVVKYYTMNTYPKKYLLNNNNLSYCHAKSRISTTGAPITDSLHRINIEWLGSSTSASLARVDTQNYAVLNYFTQWFASTGRTDVKGGAAIACQSIYPNIDLVYTSNNAGLVMYFIVYPGGNYSSIRMHIDGSKANSIVSNKLKIEANWEYSTLEKPKMYQYAIAGNVVTPLTVCNPYWQSIGNDTYQITNASSYNTSLPLIIQIQQGNAVQFTTPGLNWSTYFGGIGFDFLTKTHNDANDNLYVSGFTWCVGNTFPQNTGLIPVTNTGYDGVLSKFNSGGKLIWSILIGGSGGEEIRDFAFSGNSIYGVGKTSSNGWTMISKGGATNNGTFGGGTWDGFIFELVFSSPTSAPTINWRTFFGGNDDEELNACKFDASGNLFVVGESASSNLTPMGPGGSWQKTFNAAQVGAPNTPLSTDGIIAKFNTSSLQSWFTYFGTDSLGTTGSKAHNHAGDYFYDLAINGTDLYVCGKAGGLNLPGKINSKAVAGNFDGILVHFTTAGVLNSSKFTDGNIVNYAVKERGGDVYTVGQADGTMSPVNSSLYYYNGSSSGATDACFSVHSQNLGTTIHNSFIGGSDEEAAYDIQFTSLNYFYIAGGTKSSDFPVNSLGVIYDTTYVGLNDNFIACFQKNTTNMVYSSYLGSDWQESFVYPPYFNSQFQIGNTTIAIDSQDRLHMLGWSNSHNTFPRHDGGGPPVYFQANKSGFAPNPGADTDGTITRFDVSPLVGLKDFKNTEFVFGLYPNPTAKTISINNPTIANADLRYAIYDMSGKKLKEGSFKATDAKTVDVSFLSQGVYIINVSNGVKTYSNKFVKVDN